MSTGRTGCRPGPTCGPRTATSNRSTTSPGAGSRPSRRPSSSPGRRTSSASTHAPSQFVTTCIAYERPGRRRRPSSTDTLDITSRQRLLRHAGRARASRVRDPRTAGLDHRRHAGRCTSAPTGCSPRGRRRSWSPRPTPCTSASRGTTDPPTTGSGGRRPGRWSRAGRPHDRVLALAHVALRRRDVLGRRPAAQRAPGSRLRGDRRARP